MENKLITAKKGHQENRGDLLAMGGAGRDRRLLHQIKRSQIVNAIRKNKLISRHELSAITQLNAPTVSRLTRELIDENILEEVGKEDATSAGRRAVWLSLKKSSRYLVGLDIGAYESKAVLTNLESETIGSCCTLTYRGNDSGQLQAFIDGLVETLLADNGVQKSGIEAIGLATSGVIDPEAGEVVISSNLPAIQHVKIVQYLQERFEVPVEICNASGVWAMSECDHWRKMGEVPDFLILHVGYGVVLSHLIDGKAVIGRNAKAKSDFGHITFDPDGPDCRCGSQGCLEAFSSGWAIARDAQQSPSETLLGLVEGDASRISAKEVVEATLRGDPECLRIIRKAGETMGQAAACFIEFFMPKQVILTGSILTGSALYLEAMLSVVNRRIAKGRFARIDFRVTSLNKYAGAVGVTQLLAHDILHAPVKDIIRIGW